MRVPVALAHALPVGLKGAFACIMFFAMLACDGSYMHSWGGILIQDIILPFRKRPFSPEQHIRLLRWSIVGVGVFAFLFGLFFNQTEYILMFFAITGSIFLGGSGCAVLGGLYWKKGTTAAAWTSMIAGSVLATGGIVLQQCWKSMQPRLVTVFHDGCVHNYLAQHPDKFPINGQIVGFIAMCAAILLYVTVSLLTRTTDFDMDRMLHRGRYASGAQSAGPVIPIRGGFRWGAVLGFDSEFSRGDKLISISVFAWSMFWFLVFVVGSIWYLWRPWSLETWGRYWFISSILLPLLVGVITSVWLTWGGVRDLRRLFRDLRTSERNALDDGMVINHHNLDEVAGNTLKTRPKADPQAIGTE
jgi:SSS family solute:Na+ symporter